MTGYYGRPIVKAPVWRWPIPAYFFAGGLAGASSTLALAADLTGRPGLARRARLASLAGITATLALLVEDLGRPARFLNMLRVARPTSPMSMGTWLLLVYGPAAGAAAASDVTGIARPAGRAAGVVSAALGPAVATYTGVLLGDTATPVWRAGGRHLPLLFAGSAAASAGALAAAVAPAEEAGPARRLAVIGAAVELATAQAMERRLGALADPYRQGEAGRLARAAKGLTATGAMLLALSRHRRTGAALVLAGALAQRWAVFRAGFHSARDPSYVLASQR